VQWLRSSLDAATARERVAEFERASPLLRGVCIAQMLLVFAVTPAAGLWLGLASTWIPLFTTLVLLQVCITWCFVRAHRRLHPTAKRSRRSEAFMIATSPPVAMRAVDALSRDLLAEFHPLAAAEALVPREEFETLVERTLRDALHPLPMVREGSNLLVRDAAVAWQALLAGALADFAEAQRVPAGRWLESPPRLDSECTGYCPRCTQQYTRASGGCERCFDLPLKSF